MEGAVYGYGFSYVFRLSFSASSHMNFPLCSRNQFRIRRNQVYVTEPSSQETPFEGQNIDKGLPGLEARVFGLWC